MPRKRCFEVLDWPDLPDGFPVTKEYDLMCRCGYEAPCPVAAGGVIEARNGMAFIVDPRNRPPKFFMPKSIRCRGCGRVYEIESDVR